MKLNKAAYGLVEAPLEWFLTVCEVLEGMGFERQHSDPCCWGLFDENRQALGWIYGHVDDFLFGGNEKDQRWNEAIQGIWERFKWTEWESGQFTQCGVDIRQDEDGFWLSQ